MYQGMVGFEFGIIVVDSLAVLVTMHRHDFSIINSLWRLKSFVIFVNLLELLLTTPEGCGNENHIGKYT